MRLASIPSNPGEINIRGGEHDIRICLEERSQTWERKGGSRQAGYRLDRENTSNVQIWQIVTLKQQYGTTDMDCTYCDGAPSSGISDLFRSRKATGAECD